jgi:hypothetical protein
MPSYPRERTRPLISDIFLAWHFAAFHTLAIHPPIAVRRASNCALPRRTPAILLFHIPYPILGYDLIVPSYSRALRCNIIQETRYTLRAPCRSLPKTTKRAKGTLEPAHRQSALSAIVIRESFLPLALFSQHRRCSRPGIRTSGIWSRCRFKTRIKPTVVLEVGQLFCRGDIELFISHISVRIHRASILLSHSRFLHRRVELTKCCLRRSDGFT